MATLRLPSGRLFAVIGASVEEVGRISSLLVTVADAAIVPHLVVSARAAVTLDLSCNTAALIESLRRKAIHPIVEYQHTDPDRRRGKGERKRNRASRWS